MVDDIKRDLFRRFVGEMNVMLKSDGFHDELWGRDKGALLNELFECEDIDTFLIPIDRKMSDIFLYRYGKVSVSKSSYRMIDSNDIDKNYYYLNYISPFIKSIVKTFA